MISLRLYKIGFVQTLNYLKQPKFLRFFIFPAMASVLLWFVKSFIEGIFYFLTLNESNFWNDLIFQVNYLIVLTILSPVYGIVSRKVIESSTGKTNSDSWHQLVTDIIRMLGISAVMLGIQLIIIYPLYLVLWVIGLSSITTLIGFIVEAVLLGFAFFDFGLEIQRTNVLDSLQFIKKHFLHCILIGIIFLLIVKIPLFGLIIAPVPLTILATTILLQLKN